MMDLLVELLLLGAFFLEVLFIIVVVKDLKSKDVVAYWKNRAKELEEEIERIKDHYENMLKDVAIKNVMMKSLYDAWRSGKLQKAIKEGYEVELLADGTIILTKGEERWSLSKWNA